MKKLKKILATILFSKKERIIIWNALIYSNKSYVKRGYNVAAKEVKDVMNSVELLFHNNKNNFTSEEVDGIVAKIVLASEQATTEVIEEIAKREFKKGVEAGKKMLAKDIEKYAEPLRPNGVTLVDIEMEKCNKCEKRADCIIYQIICDLEGVEPKDIEQSKDSPDLQGEQSKDYSSDLQPEEAKASK